MINFAIISLIVIFLSQYMICGFNNMILKKKEYYIYNFLIVFVFQLILGLIIPSRAFVIDLTLIVFFVLSLACYYVHEFRGTNLNFSDILSINTAKEVASGYKYNIKKEFVVALIINLFLIYSFNNNGSVMIVNEKESFNLFFAIFGLISDVVVFAIRVAIIVGLLYLLKKNFNSKKYDYSISAGENEGYIYNFVSSIPIFHNK